LPLMAGSWQGSCPCSPNRTPSANTPADSANRRMQIAMRDEQRVPSTGRSLAGPISSDLSLANVPDGHWPYARVPSVPDAHVRHDRRFFACQVATAALTSVRTSLKRAFGRGHCHVSEVEPFEEIREKEHAKFDYAWRSPSSERN